MARHNELGKKGEELAESYLLHKGYHILQRNWVYGKFELDIIASYSNTLVVVEVKTRRNTLFAKPEKAVDQNKIKRIVVATQAFIEEHNINQPVRFDIISIIGEKAPYAIDHFPNAFYPPIF